MSIDPPIAILGGDSVKIPGTELYLVRRPRSGLDPDPADAYLDCRIVRRRPGTKHAADTLLRIMRSAPGLYAIVAAANPRTGKGQTQAGSGRGGPPVPRLAGLLAAVVGSGQVDQALALVGYLAENDSNPQFRAAAVELLRLGVESVAADAFNI